MTTRTTTRYPQIEVELTSQDGNAFNLIGITSRALRRAGVPEAEVKEFTTEAMSGDYDNLLQTIMRWVEVS